jgi:hypothetical protein
VILRPFLSYYGAKHRISVYYPAPRYRTIREVFAGSAGYACRYSDHAVELYDLNPIIAGVWDYLIRVEPAEIRALPAWMEKESRMSRGYWGGLIRERVASQVSHIRHWKVYNKSYEEAPDTEATWFVDPPYKGDRGKGYKFHKIDYPALGKWCEARKGQVIACEGPDGDWLPFSNLLEHKSTVPVHGKAVFGKEVVYHRSDKTVGFGFV